MNNQRYSKKVRKITSKKELQFILSEREGQYIEFKESFDNKNIAKEIVVSSDQNNLDRFESLKIGINDCFNNSLSSETIPAFNLSANARKSTSLGCSGSRLNALDILSEYCEKGTNITTFCSIFVNISNSSEDNFVFFKISDLCLFNSSNANSGEYNVCLNNNLFINEPLQKNENNLLVSKTNSIYIIPLDFNSFNLLNLANSPNFSASCFENSLLSNLELINSKNSSLFVNSCLTNSDQVTQTNLDMSNFNLSSVAKVIDAIYIIPLDFNSSNFLSSLILSDTILRATAATFISGNCSLNFFNSSSGIDTVILGILIYPGNYFNTSKYFGVFKSFDFEVNGYFISEFTLLSKEIREKTREKILDEIMKNKNITQKELAFNVGLSEKGIEWNLKKIKDKGIIERIGGAKGGYWKII